MVNMCGCTFGTHTSNRLPVLSVVRAAAHSKHRKRDTATSGMSPGCEHMLSEQHEGHAYCGTLAGAHTF